MTPDGSAPRGVHELVVGLCVVAIVGGCGAKSRHVVGPGDSGADADVEPDAAPCPDECDPSSRVDPGRECIPRFENVQPFAPRPIPDPETCLAGCPVLRVENATDVDGDVIRLHFVIDWDPNMRSADAVQTPPDGIPQDPDGTTEWIPDEPMPPDAVAYYWDVWADDCMEDSDHTVSILRGECCR